MASHLARIAGTKALAPLCSAARPFSQSATSNYSFPTNKEGRIPVTMIPGDGVGPELMDSVKEVLTSIGAPIDFETYHLSEVQHNISADLQTVVDSVNKNAICLKGVIAVPEHSHDSDLQNLNQRFRNELNLYANVVKVLE